MRDLSLVETAFLLIPILCILSLLLSTQNTYAAPCPGPNGGQLNCVVDDVQDDEDGQKDLTMVCVNNGSPSDDIDAICSNQTGTDVMNCDDTSLNGSQTGCFDPLPVTFDCTGSDDTFITWNWDDFDWSGPNTGNVCILFDRPIPANGNVDFALCVVIDDPGDTGFAQFTMQNAFSCDDGALNNCTGASLLTIAANKCGTDITNDDPFISSLTPDSKGACCTNAIFTFGQPVKPLKVCSYTSASLTSKASECIFFEPPECSGNSDCNDGFLCTEDLCVEGECTFPVDPECCDENEDCADEDICTDDVCEGLTELEGGVCVHPEFEFDDPDIPDECLDCLVDADCNFDEDACTLDACVGNVCLVDPPFDVDNDECFCSLPENELDPRCFTPAPTAPTVIIPTIGQWGIVIASLILGLYAVIRLRNIKDSEFK